MNTQKLQEKLKEAEDLVYWSKKVKEYKLPMLSLYRFAFEENPYNRVCEIASKRALSKELNPHAQ
jgi:hypothetical protein